MRNELIFIIVILGILPNQVYAECGDGICEREEIRTCQQDCANQDGTDRIQPDIPPRFVRNDTLQRFEIVRVREEFVLRYDNFDVRSQRDLELKDNRLSMQTREGRIEIKIMPDTASRVALDRLRARNLTIELKDVGKPVYDVKARRDAKLFGFINVEKRVSAEVDAESGEIIKTKEPWWGFMAKDVEIRGPRDEESDVPYLVSTVHAECWEVNGKCVTDPDTWGRSHYQGPYDQVAWAELVKLVKLADKYNVPLTIEFWPTAVDVIIEDMEKIDIIKFWQANGHEIGIHVQYSGQGDFNPNRDMEKYHLLLDNKYQQAIKSGGIVDSNKNTPKETIYFARGRTGPDDLHKDGRTSKAIMSIFNRHLTYRINNRAGYLTPELKITEYDSLQPDEIYATGLHSVDILLDPSIVENWFKFLYEKDPEGQKRMTLSDLMETYVIPNDLIIHERCGNTVWDGEERRTGSCEEDHADCEKPDGDMRVCDGGYADQIYLMGRNEVCGDGICNWYLGEDKENCPEDCGQAGKSCSELGGTKCTVSESCSGSWLTASDTGRCCSRKCQTTTIDYDDSPFGMCEPFLWEKGNKEDLAYLGVGWTREGSALAGAPHWAFIEPLEGDFDYTDSDELIQEMLDTNNKAVIDLATNTYWDQCTCHGPCGPPGQGKIPLLTYCNENAYANYLKKTIERYDGDDDYGCILSEPDCYRRGDNQYPSQETREAISANPWKHWEILNEQFYGGFWKPTVEGNEIEEYFEILKVSHTTIKEVCPNCKVVMGGIFDYLYGTRKDEEKLELIYEKINSGAGDYFDIMNFHVYGDLDNVHKALDNYGKKYPNKEKWITETGFPSENVRGFFDSNERKQAEEVVKRFAIPLKEGVSKIFWFTFYDPGEGDFLFGNYGLKKQDNTSKLAYYTYKLMTEKLEGSDWDNIQTVQESSGIYIYKFMNNGKPIWVAWNDNAEAQTISLSSLGIAGNARVTEAVPNTYAGADLNENDYPNFFDVKTVSGSITLGNSPVFVEESEGPACSEQGGTVCSSSETCSGSWLTASDTERCCEKQCYVCGDGACDDGEVCPEDCSCGYAADTDNDCCINMRELVVYLELWRENKVTILDIIDALVIWKTGC